MAEDRTLILDNDQIQKKIRRIAHHIYENHYKRKELHVVGLADRGLAVANKISEILSEISPIEIHTHGLELDKKNPLGSATYSGDPTDFKGKVVVLVDDVVNSGRTLMYAANFILK